MNCTLLKLQINKIKNQNKLKNTYNNISKSDLHEL